MTQVEDCDSAKPADRPIRNNPNATAPIGSTSWSSSAVVAGVVVGLVAPDTGKSLGVLGTMFVNLIKMMIAPVIFCTIVLGIGSVRKAASVGKVGGLALVYFLVMSTVALAHRPPGRQPDQPRHRPRTSRRMPSAGEKLAEEAHGAGGTMDFIQDIIPEDAVLLADRRQCAAGVVRRAAGRIRRFRRWAAPGSRCCVASRLLQKLVFQHPGRHPVAGTDRRVRCDRESGRRHRFRRG